MSQYASFYLGSNIRYHFTSAFKALTLHVPNAKGLVVILRKLSATLEYLDIKNTSWPTFPNGLKDLKI